MEMLFRPPLDLTGSKSLRQFFQALSFRSLQESGVAFVILAMLIALIVPTRSAQPLLDTVLADVLPLGVALLLLYAALLYWVGRPVRESCERLWEGRITDPAQQALVVLGAASLPWRLFAFGLGFWAVGWTLVSLWLDREHGLDAALPTAIGGLLAAVATHLVSFFRNKRAFLPVAETLAERFGVELPRSRLPANELRLQIRRVFVLLALAVMLTGAAVVVLQVRHVEPDLPTPEARSAAWRFALRAIAAMGVFCLGFSVVMSRFLGRELQLAVERVADAASRLAAGDLSRDLTLVATDELAPVAHNLSRVSALLRQVRTECDTALGSLGAEMRGAAAASLQLGQDARLCAEDLHARYVELEAAQSGGDFGAGEIRVAEERCDRHVLAARELETLAESLRPGLRSLAAGIGETNDQFTRVAQGADQQEQRLDGLVELSLGAVKGVAELSTLVLKVRRLTEEAGRVSSRVQSSAETGAASLRTRLEGLTAIQETISWASQSIGALGERSQQIGDILRVITGIAKQTNMLSLNAAIIAAQAGEHGPGFNIIADEIRSLADKTTAYTKMVEELVSNIVLGTDKAIEAMMLCFDRLSAEMEASQATEQILEIIGQGAQEAQDIAKHVLAVTEQEVEASTQARLATEELDKGIGATARGIKDLLSQLRPLDEAYPTLAGMLKTMSPTADDQRKRASALAAELAETRNGLRRLGRDLRERTEALRQCASELGGTRDRAELASRASAALCEQHEGLQLEISRLSKRLNAVLLPPARGA
jgi:methyl-accepting chemotaxis protein